MYFLKNKMFKQISAVIISTAIGDKIDRFHCSNKFSLLPSPICMVHKCIINQVYLVGDTDSA